MHFGRDTKLRCKSASPLQLAYARRRPIFVLDKPCATPSFPYNIRVSHSKSQSYPVCLSLIVRPCTRRSSRKASRWRSKSSLSARTRTYGARPHSLRRREVRWWEAREFWWHAAWWRKGHVRWHSTTLSVRRWEGREGHASAARHVGCWK